MAYHGTGRDGWTPGSPLYPVSIGEYLAVGWRVLAADLLGWILLTIIYIAVLLVASSTAIGTFLVIGPLEVGWYAVILKRLREGVFDIGELGKGFSRFVPAFLASAVISVFSALGFIFLIIPGLLVLAAYLFVFPLISDLDSDFWTVMETSRKVVAPRLIEWTFFVVVQALLIVLGAMACGLGILLVLPWIKIATAVAYEEVFAAVREQ